MFKNLCWFTDMHFGRSQNSPQALKDSEDFIDWAIIEAKKRQCDTFIFGGDWFDNRLTVNVNALDHALRGMEKISSHFEKSFFIQGNHDTYMREQRSISSISFGRHIDRVTIVSEPMQVGEVVLLPWLVGDEHRGPLPCGEYTFAHLELPGFMMNARSVMPESDHLMNLQSLEKHGTVFTGHFHMRQVAKNIVYTGNVMPFDFSDNWDEDRGVMFLPYGGEPEYVAWPQQPTFRTMSLSAVLEEPDKYLKPNLTARAFIDLEVDYDGTQALKEHFMKEYGLRKLELVPSLQQEDVSNANLDDTQILSIDQIVIEALLKVNSNGMKSDKLVSLYKSLS